MTHWATENYNYYNDPRVRAAHSKSDKRVFEDILSSYDATELRDMGFPEEAIASGSYTPPSAWDLCPMCQGDGTVVNPSIDSNGLTYSDFGDDPDFCDDYMEGRYDITCPECRGRTTVRAIDWDSVPEGVRKEFFDWKQAESDSYAERLAEIRMGC